jgi:rRNA maturation endonuclease Nob1
MKITRGYNTECNDCGYVSTSWGSRQCSKCGGLLKILNSFTMEEVE